MSLKAAVKEYFATPSNVRAYFESELKGIKWNGNGQGITLCPFHDDKKESLSLSESGAFFCHACGAKGDLISFHQKRHSFSFNDALNELAKRAGISASTSKPERIHIYFNETGTPLYRKLIFKSGNKKSASFERYSGGQYIKGLQGVARLLYNLHKLKGDSSRVVFLSESEKDADNLTELGLIGISSGGAESWRPEFSEFLKGRQVCILPHNDQVGIKYVEIVAKSLWGKAASIRVVDPSIFGTAKGADISDLLFMWKSQGKTAEQIKAALREIVKSTPEWTPTKMSEQDKSVASQNCLPEDKSVGTPQEAEGRLKLTGVEDILNAEPVKYLIDRILIKDTLTMLSAYAATGKSLLSLAIAKSILTGDNLFETFSVSETGGVLIIDEENPKAFLKERLQAFGFTPDMPLHFLHYQNIKLDNDSLFNELCGIIERIRPSLVIIDSLIRIHGQKENEASMAFVMGRLRNLVQLGTTVLLIHHHRKGAGDIREGIRGHSDIIGGVDMAITLEQKEDCLLLSYAKSRTVSHEPIRLELQASDGNLSFKCLGSDFAAITEVILNILSENLDGMNQTEILKVIKDIEGLDYGNYKIRQVLSRGEGIYWDTSKGGKTGKATIYKVKKGNDSMIQSIYNRNIKTLGENPLKAIETLGGKESLQSLDNSKCANDLIGLKNIKTLGESNDSVAIEKNNAVATLKDRCSDCLLTAQQRLLCEVKKPCPKGVIE
jgi:archaellum biogenesis ATPase FlaH